MYGNMSAQLQGCLDTPVAIKHRPSGSLASNSVSLLETVHRSKFEHPLIIGSNGMGACLGFAYCKGMCDCILQNVLHMHRKCVLGAVTTLPGASPCLSIRRRCKLAQCLP